MLGTAHQLCAGTVGSSVVPADEVSQDVHDSSTNVFHLPAINNRVQRGIQKNQRHRVEFESVLNYSKTRGVD